MKKHKSQSGEEHYVRKAIQGDEEAFAVLYDTHFDGIFRFIFLRVADRQTAEDIASDVFLKAWEHLPNYQIKGAPFRAWLYRIARNTITDHYRTRKEKAPLEAVINTEATESDFVADINMTIEFESTLDLLDELTDDQRNVLILKFVNGLSTHEVAKVLGKRNGAIRALQMRALKSLSSLTEKDS